MNTALAARITAFAKDAGYSEDAIKDGISYADERGFNSDDEALSLVISKILYSDEDLENGARFSVADGAW